MLGGESRNFLMRKWEMKQVLDAQEQDELQKLSRSFLLNITSLHLVMSVNEFKILCQCTVPPTLSRCLTLFKKNYI